MDKAFRNGMRDGVPIGLGCYAVAVSFVVSGLCAVMPVISEMNSGTKTIVLTILISALAAAVRPIKVEESV